jgi:predicted 2-oxoglutarate/Fe(II)-dependent dioxygenase YbiX/peroxiredoxin
MTVVDEIEGKAGLAPPSPEQPRPPAPARPQYVNLTVGDPAPFFVQRTSTNPRFHFHTVASKYIVLCFYATGELAQSRAALEFIRKSRTVLANRPIVFFGVSHDPADESDRGIKDEAPGHRYFYDDDGTIGRLYGSLPRDAAAPPDPKTARRFWLVLDPSFRVAYRVPFQQNGAERPLLLDFLSGLPEPGQWSGLELRAPILILPNVFEPSLCEALIDLYEKQGGQESGFMRNIDGKTVHVNDARHKRRKDYVIEDRRFLDETRARIHRRVVPQIKKAYQFSVTRMERYIVACYAAEDGAHFNPHRDDTTAGTAHRRFAVSINLNDDFEGGEVGFPEYGPKAYKAPRGGAVVFSCSLLHSVSMVTQGRRYAFLPFLYDEDAALIRKQGNSMLGEGVTPYAFA